MRRPGFVCRPAIRLTTLRVAHQCANRNLHAALSDHMGIATALLVAGVEANGMDQVQVSLGPGHGDIEKASLFFDLFCAACSGSRRRWYAALFQNGKSRRQVCQMIEGTVCRGWPRARGW